MWKNKATEDLFDGTNSRAARKALPRELTRVAERKLSQVVQALELNDLKVPPKNRLEALKGNRKGQHSIRINDQYRVCFVWTTQGARSIEVTDYH